MHQIDINGSSLGLILKDEHTLRVPPSQRPYAWSKTQADELFSDLNSARIRGDEEYFLGSIVLVTRDDYREIFDGQQRLATVAILISAIRDYFRNQGDVKEADRTRADYLGKEKRGSGEFETRLMLNYSDDPYFRKKIISEDENDRKIEEKKDSHKRIGQNAQIATDFVSNLTANSDFEAAKKTLIEILDFLDNAARVILLEVKDDAVAYRIFETMNDRGLKLSSADLIKNYLFQIAKGDIESLISTWQNISASLEDLGNESEIVDFLRYSWVVRHGLTRNPELFASVKKYIRTQDQARVWLQELDEQSDLYCALLTPSHKIWNGSKFNLRDTVEEFEIIGVSQVRPLLLAGKIRFSDREFAILFKSVLNWSVRALLGSISSATLEGAYAKLAKRIFDREITSTKEVLNELSSVVLDDKSFELAVANASVGNPKLARYYLSKLEASVQRGEWEFTSASSKNVNLEHVLPRTQNEYWNHFSTEDHRAYRNRLGNLALMHGKKNSKAGNESFETKSKLLNESQHILSKEIGSESQWGIQEIEKRQLSLAGLAAKTWPRLANAGD